ncbi:S53 family peptidase [Phenylobacterium sp.]|uniref:S53 family peptidase n=1 Tax=Phenylobacterium sp. TaxID=1871053 RepID=UPI0025F6D01A|nr:S53 family peptidase [Phenylobacterium sp.]
MAKQPLPGSQRDPVPGAWATGRTAGDQRLEVTVIVRRREAPGFRAHLAELGRGSRRAPMSHAEFASAYGADDSDLQQVAAFARAQGLAVAQQHAGRRTIILTGTAAQFEAAFEVELSDYEFDGGAYRGRKGPVRVPAELAPVIEAVLGLDNRPAAQPHFRIRPAAAVSASFTSPELAALYGFPPGDGAGQCIALIELGGGYKPADLKAYFQALGVAQPKVVSLGVDHAKNAPAGDPNSADGEVLLDIEVAGAIAPKATVAVYFAPNTDAGFLDAITTAAHDATHKPSVISISWGGPESGWTQQSLTAFDSTFQDAAVLGITVLVASGDNGSSDGVSDGAQHVDFPASSPHATGCGGTRLTASGVQIASEEVWNDAASGGGAGGGGVSAAFELPAWQDGLKVTPSTGAAAALTRRGVPDVAGDADPASGYQIRVDGQDLVFGGTSAVAPLWAGLIARVNAMAKTPAGFINPVLYRSPQALRDVTAGDNGAFVGGVGWDACTGLGSPNGQAVAAALGGAASPAGAAG